MEFKMMLMVEHVHTIDEAYTFLNEFSFTQRKSVFGKILEKYASVSVPRQDTENEKFLVIRVMNVSANPKKDFIEEKQIIRLIIKLEKSTEKLQDITINSFIACFKPRLFEVENETEVSFFINSTKHAVFYFPNLVDEVTDNNKFAKSNQKLSSLNSKDYGECSGERKQNKQKIDQKKSQVVLSKESIYSNEDPKKDVEIIKTSEDCKGCQSSNNSKENNKILAQRKTIRENNINNFRPNVRKEDPVNRKLDELYERYASVPSTSKDTRQLLKRKLSPLREDRARYNPLEEKRNTESLIMCNNEYLMPNHETEVPCSSKRKKRKLEEGRTSIRSVPPNRIHKEISLVEKCNCHTCNFIPMHCLNDNGFVATTQHSNHLGNCKCETDTNYCLCLRANNHSANCSLGHSIPLSCPCSYVHHRHICNCNHQNIASSTTKRCFINNNHCRKHCTDKIETNSWHCFDENRSYTGCRDVGEKVRNWLDKCTEEVPLPSTSSTRRQQHSKSTKEIRQEYDFTKPSSSKLTTDVYNKRKTIQLQKMQPSQSKRASPIKSRIVQPKSKIEPLIKQQKRKLFYIDPEASDIFIDTESSKMKHNNMQKIKTKNLNDLESCAINSATTSEKNKRDKPKRIRKRIKRKISCNESSSNFSTDSDFSVRKRNISSHSFKLKALRNDDASSDKSSLFSDTEQNKKHNGKLDLSDSEQELGEKRIQDLRVNAEIVIEAEVNQVPKAKQIDQNIISVEKVAGTKKENELPTNLRKSELAQKITKLSSEEKIKATVKENGFSNLKQISSSGENFKVDITEITVSNENKLLSEESRLHQVDDKIDTVKDGVKLTDLSTGKSQNDVRIEISPKNFAETNRIEKSIEKNSKIDTELDKVTKSQVSSTSAAFDNTNESNLKLHLNKLIDTLLESQNSESITSSQPYLDAEEGSLILTQGTEVSEKIKKLTENSINSLKGVFKENEDIIQAKILQLKKKQRQEEIRGIIIDLYPELNSTHRFSIIKGFCHKRCNKYFPIYNLPFDLEWDKCKFCDDQIHVPCLSCVKDGETNFLCLGYYFNLFVLYGTNVLNILVFGENAERFLGFTVRHYVTMMTVSSHVINKLNKIIIFTPPEDWSNAIMLHLKLLTMELADGTILPTVIDTSIDDCLFRNGKLKSSFFT